jgi:thymidylate synthase
MITEPCVIAEDEVIQAWRMAVELLLKHGERFNLVVHVRNPASLNEVNLARYDAKLVNPDFKKSVYDVANTIFPRIRRRHPNDLDKLFDYFLRVYERGQRRHSNSWGVYFLRLIRWGKSQTNQLEQIIHAIRTWKPRTRAAFVVHLSGADYDALRTIGAPCWQYGEFVRSDETTLSLTAVYRSHDYFRRALGNFAGLTRLLRFVCQQTGLQTGTLTCLSAYAFLQGTKTHSRELLDR